MKFAKKILCIVLCAAFLFASYGCKANPREAGGSTQEEAFSVEESAEDPSEISEPSDTLPDEEGVFDDQYEVALYIYYYDTLPKNYITKKEAKALG